jgi:ferredoxin
MTAADGPLPSATFVCLTLGKHVFAESSPVPSVVHSVNQLVTESRNSLSAALAKAAFAECPTKGTRQSPGFR